MFYVVNTKYCMYVPRYMVSDSVRGLVALV